MVFSRRRGASADLLVIGLGNPGSEYAHTRHNVGADVVELLATRHGENLRLQQKLYAMVAEPRIGSSRVALAFPQTYMNDSGRAAVALLRRFGIEDLAQLVVVHDELDLPTGKLRIRQGGGIAGHNGLRSIVAAVKSQDFVRVRIGIGKPAGGSKRGADHVLSRVGSKERAELDLAVEHAADAIEECLSADLAAVMTKYNASGE